MKIETTAPARANLLGEHTDYNLGFVFPTPLPFKTTVRLSPIAGDHIELVSTAFPEKITRKIGTPKAGDWADYVIGCMNLLQSMGHVIPALRVEIHSDIPMGAGISSSAALGVATLRALRQLLNLDFDDVTLAKYAQKSEREYVGVPCGIMDQTVSSVGQLGKVLMLDTRDMSMNMVSLPMGYQVMLVNCGKKHRLADGGGYRERVAECQKACELLGVKSLRECGIADLPRIDKLPDPLNRRARHVVTENQRVLDAVLALQNNQMDVFFEMMAQSHISQRDDYEVSIDEINRLVESSWRFGVRGARLTGGGFGGSIVALVRDDLVDAWWGAVYRDSPQSKLITNYGLRKAA